MESDDDPGGAGWAAGRTAFGGAVTVCSTGDPPEADSATPHEKQKRLRSSISLEHDGHLIMELL